MSPPWRLELTRVPGVGPDAEILGVLRDAVVVEIGCGSGHNLAHLVDRHGAAGIGIDHDPAKVERARSLYGNVPGLRFVLGDAVDELQRLGPDSADVVMSIFGALSFTDDLRPLLAVCGQMLRPAGRFLVTIRAGDHHDQVTLGGFNWSSQHVAVR